MKVSVNDKELFTLTDLQKKVILNDLHCKSEEELIADLSRRLHWVLILEKHDRCFQRLKTHWDEKFIMRGIDMLPTGKEAYSEFVFSQPDYKNRVYQEAEGEALRAVMVAETIAKKIESKEIIPAADNIDAIIGALEKATGIVENSSAVALDAVTAPKKTDEDKLAAKDMSVKEFTEMKEKVNAVLTSLLTIKSEMQATMDAPDKAKEAENS